MSAHTASYAIRYTIPSLQQQMEVAVVHAAHDIHNEDPATADHANRMKWANWVAKNSSVSWFAFSWPVALNPTISAAVEADPSGSTVKDSDVQFVINSNLEAVIADFVANPPPGA
jgi:hypothetical protein